MSPIVEQDGPVSKLQALMDENQRLRQVIEKLPIVNDLSRATLASLNSQENMVTIILRPLRAVNAEQGVLTRAAKDQLVSMDGRRLYPRRPELPATQEQQGYGRTSFTD